MKRLLVILCGIFVLLLTGFLAVWLAFVYPNDSRIALFKRSVGDTTETSSGPKEYWIVKKRFFADNLSHRFDVEEDVYKLSRQRVEPSFPREAQSRSDRFSHSKQLYLPIGLYPYRLDGRDGIFIPAGGSLFVSPRIVGRTKIQIGVWAPVQTATIDIAIGKGESSHRVTFVPPTTPLDPDSLLYRVFGKWFHVDMVPGEDFAGWADTSTVLDLVESDEVRFECQTSGDGCFLSEPFFGVVDQTERKNFLVILVDTLRRDGIDSHISPSMYRLAQNSVRFSKAIAPGNMTSPSTNALLSCRLPTELGGWAFAYGVSKDERNEVYRKAHRSFPDAFSRAGYLTTMIGSVSVISELYGVGVHHGFNRQIAIETDGLDTAQITRETQTWLAEHASQRFLLYMHLNAPHAPYKAPLQDIFATWPGLSAFGSYGDILRWLYASEVHYTDRYVDALLKTLDELGLSDNTVIALIADHGDQMRVHKFSGNEVGPSFEGSYFDHGATLLDDEIGVPMIIHDPKLKRGMSVDDYVSTIDLGPTLMDMAGLPNRVTYAGKSLVPYIYDGAKEPLERRVLASEGFQGRAIIFDNRYKYIKSYEPTQKRIHRPYHYISEQTLFFAKEQLYDLTKDPAEEQNLASAESGLMGKARELYRRVFGVKEGWELVVESPEGSDIRGEFPIQTKLRVIEGEATLSQDRDKVYLQSNAQSTLILRLSNWDPKSSWLRIGDRELAIKKTSLRLPLNVGFEGLPIEPGGHETLIPYPREASAYIRRVEESGREERKIRITNPAFESVLREWGYLNDR